MRHSALTRQRLVGVFVLGLLLLYSPVLALFDVAAEWAGFAVAYLYLFGAWLLLLVLAAFTVEGRKR